MSDGFDKGVIVVVYDRHETQSLAVITRATATTAVIERKTFSGVVAEMRFRRKDGWQVGANTHRATRIAIATDTDVATIREKKRREKLIRSIRGAALELMTTPELQTIHDALPQSRDGLVS